MGFAGKRFLFSPPLPDASIKSVALAPFFAQPKSEKRLQRAESPTETLATQAIGWGVYMRQGGPAQTILFFCLFFNDFGILKA